MGRFLRRLLLCLMGLLLIFLAGAAMLRVRYLPDLCSLGQTQARNTAAAVINRSVSQAIDRGDIQYDRIILFEKDVAGHVTALKTNMQEVNRLKASILQKINLNLLASDADRIGVSLGSLLLPEAFFGMGPVIPVHIQTVRSSSASFESSFSQAGINQTLHQIHMQVAVEGTILVLGETRNFSVSTTVLVAETVIVGQVPNSFS